MTRIVAGTAGGRRLDVPARGTRPTSDRVREALFSRLEHLGVVEQARVLDLYAGSGALGLEAASRGAAEVTLVEAARPAAEVCRRNARALGLPAVSVVADRALPWLERRSGHRVDLLMADPPYDVPEAELSRLLEVAVGHLAPEAVVVVERSSRSPEPGWPDGMERTDRRRYGETTLWFAEPAPQAAVGRTPGAGTADLPTVAG